MSVLVAAIAGKRKLCFSRKKHREYVVWTRSAKGMACEVDQLGPDWGWRKESQHWTSCAEATEGHRPFGNWPELEASVRALGPTDNYTPRARSVRTQWSRLEATCGDLWHMHSRWFDGCVWRSHSKEGWNTTLEKTKLWICSERDIYQRGPAKECDGVETR